MALTQAITVVRRGPASGVSFGYLVAAGEVIYAGGLFGLNSSGNAVRIQTAGCVVFVGMALNTVNNTSGSTISSDHVVGSNDTFGLTVPSATPSNINAKVYATDDATLTLTAPTSGFEGIVGYLAGIDNSQTYVKLQGH